MKPDVKNAHSDIMIECLQNTVIEIEALEEYYRKSIENVQDLRRQIEKDYEIGLLIDTKLKSALENDNVEEVENAITELLDYTLTSGKKVEEYISIVCENKEGEPKITYHVNEDISERYIDPKAARRKYNKIRQYEDILVTSTLSNIIIIFERYLSCLYTALILINPKKYFEDQKIEIASIFNKNVSEVVLECIEKEVESNMFDSLKAMEVISQKEKIDINRYGNIQDDFEEIYYRRNLFVHNNGRVNKIYLSNIKDKFKSSLKINQRLITDQSYIYHAIDVLYKIVCTLFYEIQVSFNASYYEWKDKLNEIGFDFLLDKKYEVAKQIYLCMSNCKKFLFIDKAMFKVNYIIALKQQGKIKEVEHELSTFDVSIATDDFKIAKLCLEDNNEAILEMLQKTYPSSFPASAIRDWPLFIDFRKTEYYIKFVEDHKVDFSRFEVELENENDLQNRKIN